MNKGIKGMAVLILLLAAFSVIAGCVKNEIGHTAGERCNVESDCPHPDDTCHNGFCESPEEHKAETKNA